MAISQLTLQNFRNYPQLRLEPSSDFIILSGDNGAGKTNILEAVSLLAPGRGLRRSPLKDIANDSRGGGFAVAAAMDDVQLGTGTSDEQPDRRKTRINGAATPTNDLAQWLSILWLTPTMDRLFLEGASGRRNFLDRLVTALEPEHARNSSRYDAARRERNKLLSQDIAPDTDWVDALDKQLARFGAPMAAARQRLVDLLNTELAASDDHLFAAAALGLTDEASADEGELLHMLATNRRADRSAGRTLRGPHRTDLAVHHRSKRQVAEKCSTGEQKALLFSIILAHADLVAVQRGERPILLLDEVAAHLDPSRRTALFDRLHSSGGQVWLTGTESTLFNTVPEGAAHYYVDNGSVHPR